MKDVSWINVSTYTSWKHVTGTVQGWYQHYLSLGDERVKDWPMMHSPLPTVAIAVLYVAFCVLAPKKVTRGMGSKYCKLLLVPYNLLNIVMNMYIGRELFMVGRDYNLICEPVNYSSEEAPLRAASALWWYYVIKGVELLDTAFFVVRGKFEHITFLHVYHHSTMFCLWWIGVKYVAGGSAVFGAMINCGVHVVMYTYYTLAALGPGYKRYLWWKRYLTAMQMVQFVAAIVMGVNAIIVGCDFPMWMQYSMIAYMVSFLVLFTNFCRKTYTSSSFVPGKSASQLTNSAFVSSSLTSIPVKNDSFCVRRFPRRQH